MTFDVDGDPAQAYDATLEDMGLTDGQPPDGAVWHYAGPHEDGWRVIDMWEDEAAYERFAQEKIGPIAGSHGVTLKSLERIPVTNSFENAGQHGGFVQIVRTGLSEADFKALDEKVRPDGQPPSDLRHHANGPDESGNSVVVDSWASREARDAFMQAHVFPNAPEGMHPAIEDLEVHNSMARATATA